jgi:hypothetical protein
MLFALFFDAKSDARKLYFVFDLERLFSDVFFIEELIISFNLYQVMKKMQKCQLLELKKLILQLKELYNL